MHSRRTKRSTEHNYKQSTKQRIIYCLLQSIDLSDDTILDKRARQVAADVQDHLRDLSFRRHNLAGSRMSFVECNGSMLGGRRCSPDLEAQSRCVICVNLLHGSSARSGARRHVLVHCEGFGAAPRARVSCPRRSRWPRHSCRPARIWVEFGRVCWRTDSSTCKLNLCRRSSAWSGPEPGDGVNLNLNLNLDLLNLNLNPNASQDSS